MVEFNPKLLRQSLERFDPSEATLCDYQLQQYLKFYQQQQFEERCEYSIGLERVAGQSVACFLYRPRRAPRGTVILLHGYMEHSGLYSRLIEYLLQQDWMVFSFDLPGHGLSSGEPYAIGDFSEYAATLVELLSTHQQQLPGPWVMIGQSTGAAVMMEQLLSYPDSGQDWPMVGRVLVSPLVRPAMLPVIRWKYSWFGWCLQRVRRSYGDSSGDQQFLDFIRYQDPLQYQWIPVSWVGAMLRWLDRVEQAKARDEQVLIVQGDKDSTLDWQYNLQLLKKIFPTQQLHTITGARHQLIQEESAHRDQVFSQIAEFLSRVPTGYQHAS